MPQTRAQRRPLRFTACHCMSIPSDVPYAAPISWRARFRQAQASNDWSEFGSKWLAGSERENALMGAAAASCRLHPLNITFQSVAAQHALLADLPIVARLSLSASDSCADISRLQDLSNFSSDMIQIRPGVQLHSRLGDRLVLVGGREVSANVLQDASRLPFVAVHTTVTAIMNGW